MRRRPARAVRGRGAAALQRGGRVRRPGRPGDLPALARSWASRRRTRCTTCAGAQHYKGDGVDDYVWVFLISGAAPPAHFIGGYKGATQRAPAPDVLPAGRRHGQRRQQARLDRLEPRVRHGRQAAVRPRRGRGGGAARARKPSAAGARPRRSGPSCTRSCRASPATR